MVTNGETGAQAISQCAVKLVHACMCSIIVPLREPISLERQAVPSRNKTAIVR